MIEYHMVGYTVPLTCTNSIRQALTEIYHSGKKPGAPMGMFTVTYGTSDFGQRYVVRYGHGVMEGGVFKQHVRSDYVIASDLDTLRQVMPEDCVIFSRDAADDPVIVETWI